uniref:Galanin receptor type 1 n=1 Tax=Knipowitschia caucasica TaxID=637954 RepID=A0AAV2K4H6_KNICA
MDNQSDAAALLGVGLDNFISLLIFALIFTLGVLGNTLVITVLARTKPGQPRSTTNIFILNLSVADLSYLLFCVPFQSTIYVLPTWVLGAFICKFIHYFFTVSMLVSIFTLSAMSVDRYVAIVHARKSSSIRVARHAALGVLLIWTLSLAMASPVAHFQSIVEREDNNTYCWEVWPDQHRKVYVLCTFVFGYLLPLLLISVCYAKVLNHLHKKLKNGSKKSELSKRKTELDQTELDQFELDQSELDQSELDQTELDQSELDQTELDQSELDQTEAGQLPSSPQTALTVLVVVVVFCLSWLPHHVVHLWVEFGSFPLNQASFVFRMVAHSLAYSNSSVNPVIYAFLSENFRNSYKQVFWCRTPNDCPLHDAHHRSRMDTAPSTNISAAFKNTDSLFTKKEVNRNDELATPKAASITARTETTGTKTTGTKTTGTKTTGTKTTGTKTTGSKTTGTKTTGSKTTGTKTTGTKTTGSKTTGTKTTGTKTTGTKTTGFKTTGTKTTGTKTTGSKTTGTKTTGTKTTGSKTTGTKTTGTKTTGSKTTGTKTTGSMTTGTKTTGTKTTGSKTTGTKTTGTKTTGSKTTGSKTTGTKTTGTKTTGSKTTGSKTTGTKTTGSKSISHLEQHVQGQDPQLYILLPLSIVGNGVLAMKRLCEQVPASHLRPRCLPLSCLETLSHKLIKINRQRQMKADHAAIDSTEEEKEPQKKSTFWVGAHSRRGGDMISLFGRCSMCQNEL